MYGVDAFIGKVGNVDIGVGSKVGGERYFGDTYSETGKRFSPG
jgi:uncharacterized protein (UPF0128 family)